MTAKKMWGMRTGGICNATFITHHWIASNTLGSLNKNGFVNQSAEKLIRSRKKIHLFANQRSEIYLKKREITFSIRFQA